MNKLKEFWKIYAVMAVFYALLAAMCFADTPPQVINKLCSANQFFSQIQPGPGNINCTQPTYSGLANLPSFQDSLSYVANVVTLVNDSASPGNSKYYGTNSVGGRGFYDLPNSAVWGLITGTLSNQTDLQNALNAKQNTGNYITALTGDLTASGPGSSASTLATVNSNVGSFGSSTAIPNFTVNGKGLTTAAGTSAVVAPAGTLTGTTLASNVVTSSLTSVGALGSGTWNATTIAVNHGGTGVTSVTTSPASSSFAGWDANKNFSANTFIPGFTLVGAAGGTTTLTVSSAGSQYVTGSNDQTIKLPVVSTLPLGFQFYIKNVTNSGTVTVLSSGLNVVAVLPIQVSAVITCVSTSGTGAGSWDTSSLSQIPAGGDLGGYYPKPSVATVGGASAGAIGNWINNGHISVNTASISMNSSDIMILQAPTGSGAFQALDGVGSNFFANADASIGMFSSTGLSAQLNSNGIWAVLASSIAEGDLSGSSITIDGAGGGGMQFSSGSSVVSDDSGNLNVTSPLLVSVSGSQITLADTSLNQIYTDALGIHFSSLGSNLTGPSLLAIDSNNALTTFAATESANTIFSGPTTGAAAQPTFRSLVAADIPSLSSIYLPLTGGTLSGVVKNINGSAGAPSWSFSPSPNTGIYSSSANTLDFSANGVQAFSINSSQNATGFGNLVINKQVSLGGGSAVQSVAMVTLGNIAQTSLSGTTEEGVLISGRCNSSATARCLGATFEYRTDASAFTTGVGAGIRILTPTVGASSAVTRNIGIDFQGLGSGAPSSSFLSDNEAFTGNYLLNFTSTNPSVLPGGIVGVTTGSAAATGNIGQVVTADVTALTNTGASTAYFDSCTLTSLAAGSWRLEGTIYYTSSAVTWSLVDLRTGVSTTTGNSSTGLVNATTLSASSGVAQTSFNNLSVASPVVFVNPSTATTYYLKGYAGNYSVGTPQYQCHFTAQRIF